MLFIIIIIKELYCSSVNKIFEYVRTSNLKLWKGYEMKVKVNRGSRVLDFFFLNLKERFRFFFFPLNYEFFLNCREKGEMMWKQRIVSLNWNRHIYILSTKCRDIYCYIILLGRFFQASIIFSPNKILVNEYRTLYS